MTTRSTRPVVYVAGSMSSYGKAKRQKAIARTTEVAESQGFDVFLPEQHYHSHAAWLRGWRELVRSGRLAGLVVVPETDGTIGAGVMGEVSDALAYDVPVYVWRANGLQACGTFALQPLARPTARKAARIIMVEKSRRKAVA